MDGRLIFSKLSGQLKPSRELQTHCERLEQRRMLTGNVTANISSAGDLIVNGDNAGNEISVEIAADGTVSIVGDAGTTVDAGNLASEKLRRGMRINLRGGDDVLTISGVDADLPIRDMRLNSGSGHDQVLIDQLRGIERDMNINAGSGDDFVTVEYSGVGRNLTVAGSSGTNEIRVNETEVGTLERAALKISTSSGDDRVFLDDSSVYGDVNVRTGGGNDRIDMRAMLASEGGKLSVLSGSGNDEVYLTDSGSYTPLGSDKYGSVSLNTSSGDDVVQVLRMEGKELAVNTGSGGDQLTITNSQLDMLDVKAGSGDDFIGFGPQSEVNLSPFRINGGGGIDEVKDLDDVISSQPAELTSIESLT